MTREWTCSNYESNYKPVKTGVTIEWEFQGGGYSWALWALVSKDNGEGKLYAPYITSGCSCYGPYEDKPSELAWTPNLKEAAASISRNIRDDKYGPGDDKWAPDQKAGVLASLSQAVMKLR